ncbi:TerB family tellurite resistance protein [Marinobacterium rhizophilum]|uniref:TerB family tellurite resistance protein n=1 Tax=Marinobacterium rhizophilum TaxID=420402 RepID=A0ABY5HG44_9GAMM|nr:TerB family tellurite resistance protein [Marinobacterium rhizophilum]UTW10811.1 TerB family tellurite resistance protein [Marinobacterium rhizophilum]
MFNRLKTALADVFQLGGEKANAEAQETVSLISAALMVEVIASDYEHRLQERDTLLAIIQRSFGLDAVEADALVQRAHEAQHQATDYFRFTSRLNDICTPQEKVALIENLWRIAFADGELHHYEEHVIRRIADLIHVPHMAFIAAKHRAEAAS